MAGVIDLPVLVQRIRLNADTNDAENATRSTFTRIGEGSVKTGKILTAGLTLPIVGLAVAGVQAASNLAEANSKVGVVFGENADQVRKFADTSADAIGISERKALEATGTFGNLFRAIGLGAKESADLSIEMVKLSSDLASFNDANPDDVLLALKSGLVGETEPLRAFGVSLSAARVEAEAFALGLVKPVKNLGDITAANIAVEKATKAAAEAQLKYGKGSLEHRDALSKITQAEQKLADATAGSVPELDAATKAMATRSIIMKDTSLAQGDFARTSEGLANSQRKVTARADNAATTIGTKLMPVAQKLTKIVNSLLDGFNKLSPSQQSVAITLGLIAAAAGPVLIVLGKMISSAGTVAKGFGTVVSAGQGAVGGLGRLVGGFRNAQVAESAFSGRLGTLGGLLRKTASGFGSAASAVGSAAVSVGKSSASMVVSLVRTAGSALAAGATMVGSFVATAAAAVASAAAVVAAWLVAAAPFILVGLAVAAVVALIVKNWDTIKAATVAVWNAIGDFLSGVWDGIKAVASTVFDGIRAYFETVFNVYRTIFTTVFDGIKAYFTGVFAVYRTIFEGFVAVVGGIVGAVAATWRGVTSVFVEVRDFVRDRISDIVGFVTGLPGRIGGIVGSVRGAFTNVGGAILDGILDGLKAAVTFAGNFARQIANALIDLVNRNVIERINRGVEFRIEVFGKGVDINPPDIPRIPHLATGGRFQGAFVAGERGREIVTGPYPTGEVLNNQTSNRLLAALGGRPQVIRETIVKEVHSPITVESPADPEEIAAANRFRLLTAGV